jgi:hypothetical protein
MILRRGNALEVASAASRTHLEQVEVVAVVVPMMVKVGVVKKRALISERAIATGGIGANSATLSVT